MKKLILATEKGLAISEHDGSNWQDSARGLTDLHVTCVTTHEGVILAGTKKGIYRSTDEGKTWEEANNGLDIQHIRWIASHPDISGLVLAGTEPAEIFVSNDNGTSWHSGPDVSELRDTYKWFLPYSPEAGCVRGFAFLGSRIYAAVEVGGLLVSDDNGESWKLAEGSDGKPSFGNPPDSFVHPDVHSINVHPTSSDLVYAPTGGGFYRSHDGGKSWEVFYACYCRAVWVDPQDPDHLILSPADGVDRNGRIETSTDGGKNWSLASNGLDVPWRRGMVERFLQVENDLFGIVSTGQLLRAPLSNLEWSRVLPDIKDVNAITIL